MTSGPAKAPAHAADDSVSGERPVVLLVDDEPHILNSLERVLRGENLRLIKADSAENALSALGNNTVSVVVSDNHMPGMDGISFLESVRRLEPDITRVMLTGHASVDSAVQAINRSGIFEYLTKPWDNNALKSTIRRSVAHHYLIKENKRLQKITRQQNDALRQMNKTLEQRVRRRTAQLEDAVREGILMLALAAEAKDDDTGEHVRRIQALTEAICLELGMPAEKAREIGFAAIMHDVGKIHIPDGILRKKGKLTPAEMEIMRTHTIAGEKILGDSPFYETARRIARSHHERPDGNGYPDGLKGQAIPLPARIVCVADVFDALTSERPYKSAWPEKDALDWMRKQSGAQFDETVFAALFAVLGKKVDRTADNQP